MSHPSSPKSVVESARHRRSIRKYQAQAIAETDLLEILELAGRAPSAWNLQPWRWIAVVNQEEKTKLQAAAYGQPQVGSAAAVFVVTSDLKVALADAEATRPAGTSDEDRVKQSESIRKSLGSLTPEQSAAWGRGQSNIALGYLLLVLESLGYASSPMLGFDEGKVRELYGLADHVEVVALVAVGLAADEGFASNRIPVGNITRFV